MLTWLTMATHRPSVTARQRPAAQAAETVRVSQGLRSDSQHEGSNRSQHARPQPQLPDCWGQMAWLSVQRLPMSRKHHTLRTEQGHGSQAEQLRSARDTDRITWVKK